MRCRLPAQARDMWYESIEIDGEGEFSKGEFKAVADEMMHRAWVILGTLEKEYEQKYDKEKQRTYEQVLYGGWGVSKLRDEYATYGLSLPFHNEDEDELRRELARTAIDEDVPLPRHEAAAMYTRLRRYELLGYLWARFLNHRIWDFLKDEEEPYFTRSRR